MFDALPYERLSPDEKKQLQAWEMNGHLTNVNDEMSALGKLSIEARNHLAECKKRRRRAKSDLDKEDADCAVIDAQALMDNIKDRKTTLRDLKSSLQTAIRALPG